MLTTHSLKDLPDAGGPTAAEVQSYLRELLGREGFGASERNRRFLSYVVQETLGGRADRIKAYNIALAAFDRTQDFDPLTDPIVRIEAGRLRRSLEHYYLTAGQADRIRIDIPKGSYAARFSYQEEMAGALVLSGEISVPVSRRLSGASFNRVRLASIMVAFGLIVGSLTTYGMMRHANQAAPEIAANSRPSLVIVPFEHTGGDPDRAFVARGLTYDVGTALTQLGDVAVFGPGRALDSNDSRSEPPSDFTLMGSVQTDQTSMHVAVFLLDTRTRQFLQSWSFDMDLIKNDIIKAQAELAQHVLASLRKQCVHGSTNRSTATADGTFDCRTVAIAN